MFYKQFRNNSLHILLECASYPSYSMSSAQDFTLFMFHKTVAWLKYTRSSFIRSLTSKSNLKKNMIRLCSASKKISLCFLYLCVMINLIMLFKRQLNTKSSVLSSSEVVTENPTTKLKYILIWTDPMTIPFRYFGEGQKGFISRKCAFTNCFVTADVNLLNNFGMYDVIAFHAPEIVDFYFTFPKGRLPHQKYVFASIESSANYPICSTRFNGIFNWTWTYKLDSDVRWGYIVIRNNNSEIVGPGKHISWLDPLEMDSVSDKLKRVLKNKTKAIAWFVSNCNTISRRISYAADLSRYILRYNLQVDIYGHCGTLKCPWQKEKECNKLIETDYHFYLSFENAFSEDYVTEKLLIPLQYNAIPIVYGGADYTRFLPPGSYLDARKLGVANLGDKINELMKDPEKYAEYFKWKNHYSYYKMSESAETNEYCQMCALMNNEEKMNEISVYENLQKWWDPFENCDSDSSSYEIH